MSAGAPHDDRYRTTSLWLDQLDEPLTPRPALPGDRDADVAIVGAGYTGLWTAYHLLKSDPGLRVVLLEAEIAGFGASGRNGGWCSAIFPASFAKVARLSGRDAAVRLQRTLNALVPDIGRVAADEGIDCRFVQGGYLSAARNPAQVQHARDEVATWREWGFGEDDLALLDAAGVAEHAQIAGALGGTYTPHCAAIDPARLVRGLARAVERRGAVIFEGTPATGVRPGAVTTTRGVVRAERVVLATEGYTAQVPGRRRRIAPVYSLITATEPLPDDLWDDIGLAGRPTFADGRHLVIYGQRTADGRLAFGGRGAPYHFASRVDAAYDRNPAVHAMLQRTLIDLFPALRGVRFTHAWGGNLGVPRDWFPTASFDPRTGLAFAGGYVGDGVSTSCLAGRTLAALMTGDDPDDLAGLPLANHRSPSWEPEPLRWLGVNGVTRLMTAADESEARTGRPSRAASAFWRLLGD